MSVLVFIYFFSIFFYSVSGRVTVVGAPSRREEFFLVITYPQAIKFLFIACECNIDGGDCMAGGASELL